MMRGNHRLHCKVCGGPGLHLTRAVAKGRKIVENVFAIGSMNVHCGDWCGCNARQKSC